MLPMPAIARWSRSASAISVRCSMPHGSPREIVGKQIRAQIAQGRGAPRRVDGHEFGQRNVERHRLPVVSGDDDAHVVARAHPAFAAPVQMP
jgi:hypothetical protein